MLTRKLFNSLTPRTIDSTVRLFHVCVMGGASEIGQAVSLLLRTEPSVSKLVIHDTPETAPGVVIELSHIPANSALKGYLGETTMKQALLNSDLVLIVGGLLKTPGISDKACLAANTEFVKTVSSKIGRLSKMPFVGVVTEPLNSLVPIAAEVMRNVGTYDNKKLFGITTIDWIRAQTLLGSHHGWAPEICFVPVICGHSNNTAVPLLSQSRPETNMSDTEILKFVSELQKYDEIVTQAKHGKSPTVSIAYGVLVFVRGVLKALSGQDAQVHAYIENNEFGTSYFSGLVHLDANGVKDMTKYTNHITKYECQILEGALEQLRKDVAMGKKVLEEE